MASGPRVKDVTRPHFRSLRRRQWREMGVGGGRERVWGWLGVEEEPWELKRG